jgi:acetoacetyl-CoA reductase
MSRVAIVTGGTRGIGYDISRVLKSHGYRVVATYAGNEEAAEKARANLEIVTEQCDAASYQACHDSIKKIEKSIGPVDILVNNAGITRDGFLHKMEADAWHAVIETNLTSCFNMCSAVINGMRDRGFGRIVNLSSINALRGQVGQTNYAAAKAGMLGFTKALALEGARKGITVNAICPGYIATEMTAKIEQKVLDKIIAEIPVGRMGKPEEIADMVAYLVSDKAGFITGATYSVNGGHYMD